MKHPKLIAVVAAVFVGVAASFCPNARAADQADGWQTLFNGKDLKGWHNFKSKSVKPGWQVKDGTLACVDPHNAGDLCTDGKFDWFELELEFKMGPGANSGIMYHVTDEGGAA